MPEKELTEVEILLARITELTEALEKAESAVEGLKALNAFTICPFDFGAPWGPRNDATLDTFTFDQTIEWQEKFIKGAASCMRRRQSFESDKSIKQLRADRGEKEQAKAIHERDSPRPKVGGPKLSDEAKMIRGLWRSVGPHLKREQLVAAISATFDKLPIPIIEKTIDELNAKQASK